MLSKLLNVPSLLCATILTVGVRSATDASRTTKRERTERQLSFSQPIGEEDILIWSPDVHLFGHEDFKIPRDREFGTYDNYDAPVTIKDPDTGEVYETHEKPSKKWTTEKLQADIDQMIEDGELFDMSKLTDDEYLTYDSSAGFGSGVFAKTKFDTSTKSEEDNEEARGEMRMLDRDLAGQQMEFFEHVFKIGQVWGYQYKNKLTYKDAIIIGLKYTIDQTSYDESLKRKLEELKQDVKKIDSLAQRQHVEFQHQQQHLVTITIVLNKKNRKRLEVKWEDLCPLAHAPGKRFRDRGNIFSNRLVFGDYDVNNVLVDRKTKEAFKLKWLRGSISSTPEEKTEALILDPKGAQPRRLMSRLSHQ